jgi:AcrR family transcriptional regulator
VAALAASGELGYRRLSVQAILDRAGLSRPRFYRSYANKADCYARAYEGAIMNLESDLLAVGAAAPDWLAGFRASLERLADFTGADPFVARGVLAEVHVAGGAALAKRSEVFERLSRAVDVTARRETSQSRHSPPPITAAFILNAVESALLREFLECQPGRFAAAIPDLAQIAAAVYFGERKGRSGGES